VQSRSCQAGLLQHSVTVVDGPDPVILLPDAPLEEDSLLLPGVDVPSPQCLSNADAPLVPPSYLNETFEREEGKFTDSHTVLGLSRLHRASHAPVTSQQFF
jgi:hypothetical protein